MLLKTDEVAKLLRVSKRRVSQMIDEGILSPTRIGQQAIRFHAKEIAELTDQSEEDILRAIVFLANEGKDL